MASFGTDAVEAGQARLASPEPVPDGAAPVDVTPSDTPSIKTTPESGLIEFPEFRSMWFPRDAKSVPVTKKFLSALDHLSTPTYRNDGKFTIYASTIVAARASDILAIIRNYGTWTWWSTNCPSESVRIHRRISVRPDGDIPRNGIKVTDKLLFNQRSVKVMCLEPILRNEEQPVTHETGRAGYRISWKRIDHFKWTKRSEMVIELYDIPNDGEEQEPLTELVMYETFGGVFSSFPKCVRRKSLDRLADIVKELKAYSMLSDEGREDLRQRNRQTMRIVRPSEVETE